MVDNRGLVIVAGQLVPYAGSSTDILYELYCISQSDAAVRVGAFVTDYNNLINMPKINNVTLQGPKNSYDFLLPYQSLSTDTLMQLKLGRNSATNVPTEEHIVIDLIKNKDINIWQPTGNIVINNNYIYYGSQDYRTIISGERPLWLQNNVGFEIATLQDLSELVVPKRFVDVLVYSRKTLTDIQAITDAVAGDDAMAETTLVYYVYDGTIWNVTTDPNVPYSNGDYYDVADVNGVNAGEIVFKETIQEFVMNIDYTNAIDGISIKRDSTSLAIYVDKLLRKLTFKNTTIEFDGSAAVEIDPNTAIILDYKSVNYGLQDYADDIVLRISTLETSSDDYNLYKADKEQIPQFANAVTITNSGDNIDNTATTITIDDLLFNITVAGGHITSANLDATTSDVTGDHTDATSGAILTVVSTSLPAILINLQEVDDKIMTFLNDFKVQVNIKHTQMETDSRGIKIENSTDGKLKFTNYDGVENEVQGGAPADEVTITSQNFTGYKIKDEWVAENINTKIPYVKGIIENSVWAWNVTENFEVNVGKFDGGTTPLQLLASSFGVTTSGAAALSTRDENDRFKMFGLYAASEGDTNLEGNAIKIDWQATGRSDDGSGSRLSGLTNGKVYLHTGVFTGYLNNDELVTLGMLNSKSGDYIPFTNIPQGTVAPVENIRYLTQDFSHNLATADSIFIDITAINVETGTSLIIQKAGPLASTNNTGYMTSSMFNQIQSNTQRIDSLETGGIWRGTFDNDTLIPTNISGLRGGTATINDFIHSVNHVEYTGEYTNSVTVTTQGTGYASGDLTLNGVLFHIIANDETELVSATTDISNSDISGTYTDAANGGVLEVISSANTNEGKASLIITVINPDGTYTWQFSDWYDQEQIVSSTNAGQIFIETNKTGSVNGWDTVKADINNNAKSISEIILRESLYATKQNNASENEFVFFDTNGNITTKFIQIESAFTITPSLYSLRVPTQSAIMDYGVSWSSIVLSDNEPSEI
jgi:hypothetical protein